MTGKSSKTIEKYLRNTVLFRNVADEKIRNVVQAGSGAVKHYRKGECIIPAGSSIDSVRIILNGNVIISRLMSDGDLSIYHRLGEGQIMGWESINDCDASSKFDYIADSETDLFSIDSSSLNDPSILDTDSYKQLLSNIISMNSHENLRQYRKLRILSMNSIRKKIIAYLYFEYEKQGSLEFDILYNREALAAYLSVNRSALSRELGIMEADGLIQTKGKHFKIENKELFRAIS